MAEPLHNVHEALVRSPAPKQTNKTEANTHYYETVSSGMKHFLTIGWKMEAQKVREPTRNVQDF